MKPAKNFYLGQQVCKDCISIRNRSQRDDPIGAEEIKERKRLYYLRHREQIKLKRREQWPKTAMTTCALCGEVKTREGFLPNRTMCKACSESPVRKCNSCREDKPAEEFVKHRPDLRCKECRNAFAKEWQALNPQQVKQIGKRHRSKPGYRQKVNAGKKRRYQVDPIYAEQERERARRRRAQTAGSPVGDIPSGHKEALIEAQGGRCPYCHERFGDTTLNRPHLDHYVPLAKAGPHSTDNLKLVLCAKCNVRKGDQDPQQFVQESLGQLFDLAIIPTVPVKLGSTPRSSMA